MKATLVAALCTIILVICLQQVIGTNFKSSHCKKGLTKRSDHCFKGKESDGEHPAGYILAQENTVAFCLSEKKADNKCNTYLKQQETWIIHGLWPTKDSTAEISLCKCGDDTHFDASNIGKIEGIEQYWPDLKSGDNSWLWCHEWYTHGSCAAVHNSSITNTTIEQNNYFTTTIELYKKYNITKILENSNITPSNSKGYKLDEFLNAFQNNTDVGSIRPMIKCKYDKEQQQYIIKEIRLCLGIAPNYTPFDCNVKHTCSNNTIYYRAAA